MRNHPFVRASRGRGRRRWKAIGPRRVRRFGSAGLVPITEHRTVLLPGTTIPVVGRLSGPKIIDLTGSVSRFPPGAAPRAQQQPIVWPS